MGVMIDGSYVVVDSRAVSVHAKVKLDTDLLSMGRETVCHVELTARLLILAKLRNSYLQVWCKSQFAMA